MSEHPRVKMPRQFPKDVHLALKDWHSGSEASPLLRLHLAMSVHKQHAVDNPRLLSNQILLEGLERLEQLDAEAAELLKCRFLSAETARTVAYHINVSEDTVYQRQRAAIEKLAEIIWAQEVVHLHEQARRIETRLAPASYTRLFGVAEKRAALQAHMETARAPWILTLEGIGGIGKTSLADALSREAIYGGYFRDVAWISVRQRLFRPASGVEADTSEPALSWKMMLDHLIEQFDLRGLRRQSDNEKLVGLQAHLKTCPVLMVVDNLETIADYRALVPQLRRLINPGKFLITTRYSLRGESGIYIMELTGLSPQATFDLIRYEAGAQGLAELADASDEALTPIYEMTGGNPLATKLVIGQAHTFPLTVILQRLEAARGTTTRELLDFIYAEAWALLEEDCRQVISALALTAEGGSRLELLARSAGLDIDRAVTCLQHLAMLSLVQVKGDLHAKRYSLHQLTRTFVKRQMDAAS